MSSLVPSRISLGLVCGLFVLFALATVLVPSLENAVAFSATDDGLYYPVVAQNIVAGTGCTYDGISTTNGFHPLWLVILLPVYAIFHDPWIALKAVYVLIFIFQLVAVGLFYLIARKVRMSSAGWVAAMCIMLLNLRSFTIFFSLLESPLSLVCLLLYLFYSLRAGAQRFQNSKAAFISGILIGVCFLARLDAFLLAGSFAVVWLGYYIRTRPSWRVAWKGPVFAAVGCLTLALPYLMLNQIRFGHLKTVSSWQKTSEFSPVDSWGIISNWSLYQFIPRLKYVLGLESIPAGLILAGLVVGGLAALVFVLTGNRRLRLVEKLSFCPEFPVFVIIHAVFIVLFAPLEAAASAWYWVPEILLAALVAGVCLPDWRFPFIHVMAIILVVAQLIIYPTFLGRKTMSFVKLEVAEFLRENTAPDSRGMMFDSGIVSYFSQRNFVGLNGLIGDFNLADLVNSREYGKIADEYRVHYLVLDSPEHLCDEFSDQVIYVSTIKTRFENFNEGLKSFVVFKGSPEELAEIWNSRYKGSR